MEQRLALLPPTVEIASATILLQLSDVTSHRAPAFDLALIVLAAAPEIVTTIPLKPAARILRINPAFLAPERERLGSVDLEKVQGRVMPLRTEFRPLEPVIRELFSTVSHIFPAKDPQPEHLLRR
jgi:hypothetical protein